MLSVGIAFKSNLLTLNCHYVVRQHKRQDNLPTNHVHLKLISVKLREVVLHRKEFNAISVNELKGQGQKSVSELPLGSTCLLQ